MNAPAEISSQWQRLARSYSVIEFIDVTLRGCAQVMFQNNPLTGLIFFIAIFVAAYDKGIPMAAYGSLLGTVVATLTGSGLSDRVSWRAGLYSYNGCLVGVALPAFLVMTPLVWGCIVIGSMVSVIATACIADLLKTWKVAALTAPFVLTTWVILLSSYMFAGLHSTGLPTPKLPTAESVTTMQSLLNASVYSTLFHGISQVYLFSSTIAGILLVIGLAVSSLWAALFAVVGSFLALLTALALGANDTSIASGLYSFSAVLTAIALGSTFNKPSWRVLGYTLIGVIFTVFVQSAMNTLMSPLGIPALTMPFVLASWLFLFPNQDVMPPHRQA
ncbi:urea transporter [Serratia fonticola]|uniref:urea transporter n=1 Tax=Serratia fonticola TaxID=47917 RepID=UPI000E0FC4D4|nr:urea transporter [Serratia fonticola]RDL15154.1 urea transporter [Serratia fonticola]